MEKFAREKLIDEIPLPLITFLRAVQNSLYNKEFHARNVT